MFHLDKIFKISFVLLFTHCSTKNDSERFFEVSTKIIGSEYSVIRKKLDDTLNNWVLQKLPHVAAEILYRYKIDSLLCFNAKGDKLVSCRHLYVNVKNATADDLQFVFGEKMNDYWFFWKGASIAIPREMVKSHDVSKPLSYSQLHEIALKEVYANYLLDNGEINENWFKAQFEGDGYGPYKNKAELDSNKIASCRLMWIKEKEFFKKGEIQVITDEKKRVNIIRFPLKPVESSGYLYPIGVTLLRSTLGVTWMYIDKKTHYENKMLDYRPVGKSDMNTMVEFRDSIRYSGDTLSRENIYKVVYILGMKKGYMTSDSVWARKSTSVIP